MQTHPFAQQLQRQRARAPNCANRTPLCQPNAGKNTDQNFATSAMLVKNAITVELSRSNSPIRMKLSCLRVSNVSAVQKPSTKTEENIARSRGEHIKHLLETGAVKDWNREDAIMKFTKKSREIVRESLPRSRTHQCLRLLRILTTHLCSICWRSREVTVSCVLM